MYKNLTLNDIDELLLCLKNDFRYQNLDRLSEERKGLLLKHIAFLMNKPKSFCTYGLCVEKNLVNYLEDKYKFCYEKFFKQLNNCDSLLAIKNYQFNCILLSNKKVLNDFFISKLKVCRKKVYLS